ncbi:acyl-CoA synthetase MbcS [Fervidibacillus halotolerans]|uniref:Acyl--CoA ligase n=1 Tax=Fervidibacillus halotolerans TaxID=2980027 RepID=A0A9E8M0G0_9BACI|nr:acyl--CoA ligase [Fervidibacillus halotolerans]WAA12727.1 acyl--CoA ligase [Fervidibacillus halotolerans]
MKREQLIAPEFYNFAKEVEKYAEDSNRVAIKFVSSEDEYTEVTYKELLTWTNRYANALKREGLKKGDRVLLIVPKSVESYYLYLACIKSGIVIIPCSEMLRAKDLSYRIHHSEAKAVIAYDHLTEEIDKIEEEMPSLQKKLTVGTKEVPGWDSLTKIAEIESVYFEAEKTKRDEMALLPYTSGTTGNPKAVVHNHGWPFSHLQIASQMWLNVKETDTVWATAAPGWQKWVWSPFVSAIGLGATAFVYGGKFDPEKYLQLMETYEINVLCCTPTEYRFMAKLNDLSRFSLKSLRSAVSAGEPLNAQIISTFKNYFNIDVRDGYGQTENTLLVGNLPGEKIKPGSMGKPMPGYIIEIIDEEGNPVKPGEVGDIAVHKSSPALFQEYFKDPERTNMAFRGDWYLTGDQAKKDEDGYFWYEGRRDDIIISSGYTIGPFEVEDALTKHPNVRECAVVASPEPERGSVVKAFIVLRDPSIPKNEELVKDIQDHVKRLTAPYKYPRKIEFVDELPKTTSGKIRRVELRKMEMEKVKEIRQ